MPEKTKILLKSKDDLAIYHWLTWTENTNKDFVFLFPSSSMSSKSLHGLEKELNDVGFPTIGFDPRGTGISDAPIESEYYSLDNYSDDIKRVMDRHGIEKPIFIGHSYAFMPIAKYVADTDNAKKIFGLCASYNFLETASNPILFKLFDNILRYGDYIGNGLGKLAGRKNKYLNQSNLEGKSDLVYWISLNNVPTPEITAHIASGKALAQWDVKKYVKKIKNDIGMILAYGNKDIYVADNKAITGFRKNFKRDFIFTVVDGSHVFPITNAKQTYNQVLKPNL